MAELAQTILTVVMFGFALIPGILAATIIAGFLYLRYFKQEKDIDVMKRMFDEMVQEAVANKENNLSVLERIPVPAMLDIRSVRANGPDAVAAINRYTERLSQIRGKGTFMGKITGHATFDLMATIQDLMLKFDEKPEFEHTEGMSPAEQAAFDNSKKAREGRRQEYEKILNDAGHLLHFFVYEVKTGTRFFIFPKIEQRGIFAFGDQIFGLDSDDGTVQLAGEGTARLAVYFQILSGYPDRLDLIRTHMVSYSRIYTSMVLEANVLDFVMRAVGGDVDYYKALRMAGSQVPPQYASPAATPVQAMIPAPQQEQKRGWFR